MVIGAVVVVTAEDLGWSDTAEQSHSFLSSLSLGFSFLIELCASRKKEEKNLHFSTFDVNESPTS